MQSRNISVSVAQFYFRKEKKFTAEKMLRANKEPERQNWTRQLEHWRYLYANLYLLLFGLRLLLLLFNCIIICSEF